MKEIDLEKATVSLLNESIIHIPIKSGHEIELSDAVYIERKGHYLIIKKTN
ncbi:MAG: hypothetical protein V4506_02445 [Bacteroidota bacterium]